MNKINIFKGKTVVVTGHTGFKGSWLSNWLIDLCASVSGISKDIPTSPSNYEALRLSAKINHNFLDILVTQLKMIHYFLNSHHLIQYTKLEYAFECM